MLAEEKKIKIHVCLNAARNTYFVNSRTRLFYRYNFENRNAHLLNIYQTIFTWKSK